MMFQQELQNSNDLHFKKGVEQGIEQGIMQTTRTAIIGFYSQGLTIANIAKGLKLSIEEVEEILSSSTDDSNHDLNEL